MRFRLTALVAGLAMTNMVFAATEIDLHRQPAAYLEKVMSAQTSNSKVKILVMRTDTDFNGATHTRVRQTYEGIPVWDAEGVIHTPKANPTLNRKTLLNIDNKSTMNGIVYENLEKDLSSTPTLMFSTNTAAQALRAAKNIYTKTANIKSVAFQNEKSKPIIYIDNNKQAHRAYLTSFTYMTPSQMHRPTAIVDAATQKVYRNWDGIFTAASSSSLEEKALQGARAKLKQMLHDNPTPSEAYDVALGGIGGNPKMGEVVYDGAAGNKPALKAKAIDIDWELLPGVPVKFTFCLLMDSDITVVDTSEGEQLVANICIPKFKAHNDVAWMSINKDQTRWDADEMNEGYSPSLDAFNAANMVKNMYNDWFNSFILIDDNGRKNELTMRVHFGRKFDNAFWDGVQMTFGDGGSMFYPLTSNGVTAHEMSHGFTETHSHIDASNPQMAALHESFSDMAAVTLENYMTGKNGWDIGRDIMKNEGALRYLDNPTKDGRSADHMKDFDPTDPHLGAGITNKAFYLLATTKGWTVRKAFEVMVKANTNYWTSSMTTFAEAACGVVNATKDYGYNIADVRIAFAKVGIDTDTCQV